jgi:hypothetical protein
MKMTIMAAALLATTAIAAPASATTFEYDVTLGNGIGAARLTVDTNARTATYRGANINLTLTDNDLRNFNGGVIDRTFSADNAVGTFTANGIAYTARFDPWRPTNYNIDTQGPTLDNSLWIQGRDSRGNTQSFDFKGGLTVPPPSGSTSTGGSTGSTGGSTGGTTSTGGSTGGTTSTGGSTGGTTSTGGSTGGTTSTGGGSTGGGSTGGGSTGGTPVPAPGALLLFGLGAAGLFAGRRLGGKK